ncbi:hypothetical protein V6N11_052907 [Hibiscus sabdariffa]|uniref:NAB domain-containing protein n=1 Tax=Hibiscus sabdariffa TaxID=183260 RepID=A0ABR2UBG9_9ROSI
MLQKVASNAYSWWWSSHIRTKQSKWLEQNLHDMEERISGMLEIIDDDGDSFIKRANMYFRRRPELLHIVEETYRAYRELAERYDLLSRDVQTANRTIASMFPDQVPYSIHDEDDEHGGVPWTSSSPHTPRSSKPGPRITVLKKEFRSQSMLSLRKGQFLKAMTSVQTGLFPNSGLSKTEALEEINKLQKEILEMQTEGELVKNSYEQGYKRLCDIDNGITEKQKRICSLQDEYDIGSAIDDNEARVLMANRVLKSCQESLDKLQLTHEQSTEEGRVESLRIKKVNEKFEALRRKFKCPSTNQQGDLKKVSSTTDVHKMVHEFESAEKGRQYMESLQKEIEGKLELSSTSSLTMPQLADKIDDLVQRVVNLENAVFSETASVKRLKSDADEIQEHVKILEEDEEALAGGSYSAEHRISQLEGELSGVKYLLRTIIDQNNLLKAHFAEASCNINHLSENLHALKIHDIESVPGDSSALKDTNVEMGGKDGRNDVGSESGNKMDEYTAEKKSLSETATSTIVDSESGNKMDAGSEKGAEQMDECKAEKKSFSETASSTLETENPELESDEEEELQNLRKLFKGGTDEREKILLDEYSSVLRNYKDVRKKLKEVDQKNRDGFSLLASEIRELKNALASRDDEIQFLRQKSGFIDENKDGNLTEYEASHSFRSPDSTLSDFIEVSPKAADEGKGDDSSEKEAKEKLRNLSLSRSRSILTAEGKIRSDIDELLEDNISFWLRFCTCFHQIQKYQTSVQDLKSELLTLRERKKQEATGKEEPLGSEARPIYAHLREIQTELTLWLESNAVLKDEVQVRHSSLRFIEEEISRMSSASGFDGEPELNGYQAASFQGEVQNMKQENSKVWNELEGGFECMQQLKEDIENIMANLEMEFEAASASKQKETGSRSRNRVPLRSFLFGMKLKNTWQQGSSMFMCGQPQFQSKPQFQRQNSYLADPTEPP